MPFARCITDLIGNTPLLELSRYAQKNNLRARLLGKLEYFNPAGSIKDRTALSMLDDAERKGLIRPGVTIIEPTSGNTGIGLAAISAARGYRLILTMPETMSIERRNLLKIYGAELILTEGALGMKGAIDKAEKLLREIPNSFSPSQFTNPANPLIHHQTTGPEIWKQTEGQIDYFVCAVGTGGTITGAGQFLKSQNPKIKVIAVEPAGSPFLSQGESGPHQIQGIGAGFIPETLNSSVYDTVLSISDQDAFSAAQMIATTDGVLLGISSGAALFAAAEIGKMDEAQDKTIVVILPDTGERYISTPLFG